jgi:hypothetical protein
MEVTVMANLKNEKKKNYPKPMSIITHVFWTGLFGGIFWSLIGYLAYLLSFTDIHPHVILEPWALGDWKKDTLGTIISIIFFGILSIGAAFLYFSALKKLNGVWPGMIFGIVIFFVVFLILNPLFPSMGPFKDLSRDTIITSFCLYLLYGLFIGYSISYEYQNQRISESESQT